MHSPHKADDRPILLARYQPILKPAARAFRSADSEHPTLEPSRKWIGWPAA